MTPTFVVSQQFQDSFLEASVKDDFNAFYDTYGGALKRLAESLARLEWSGSRFTIHKKPNKTWICNNFGLLCQLLWDKNCQFNIDDSSVLKAFLKAKKEKNWKKFFEKHEHEIDGIIRKAKEQQIVTIYIERNGLIYESLENTRKLKKGHEWKDSNNPDTRSERRADRFQEALNGTMAQLGHLNFPPPSGKTANSKTKVKETSKDIEKYREAMRVTGVQESYETAYEPNPEDIVPTPSPPETPIDWDARREQQRSSFRRKLDAQNDYYNEKIREIRENRERIQREADEELLEMRRQSALRMRFFLECFQLKMRWEEQADQWNEWMKAARRPVERVKKTMSNLQFDWRRLDAEERKSEMHHAHTNAKTAYAKLLDDFDRLHELSGQFADKLFLRVTMKLIGDVASNLCRLLEAIDVYLMEPTDVGYEAVLRCNAAIDAAQIPMDWKLREICSAPGAEHNRIYANPPWPKEYSNP